jgi:hypothetical protein
VDSQGKNFSSTTIDKVVEEFFNFLILDLIKSFSWGDETPVLILLARNPAIPCVRKTLRNEKLRDEGSQKLKIKTTQPRRTLLYRRTEKRSSRSRVERLLC